MLQSPEKKSILHPRAPRVQSLLTNAWYSPVARSLLINSWYSLVTKLDKAAEATFMNYGFAALDDSKIPLQAEDEEERYSLQLYHHVASGVSLKDKDVLEVGCGRGGGASYIARYLAPRRMVATDINTTATRFNTEHYKQQKNLTFAVADAQHLPFDDNSFDAVVNVESAHHYPSMDAFIHEVWRVLKPGGHFLMACYEDGAKDVYPKQALARSKLQKVSEEDITDNVVRALDLDSARRETLIRKLSPRPFRSFTTEFAGVPGTKLYDEFATHKCPYFYFIYKK